MPSLAWPGVAWPCAIYMRSEIYTLMLTLEKIITNYLRMQKRLYVSIEFAISDVHTSLHAIPCQYSPLPAAATLARVEA